VALVGDKGMQSCERVESQVHMLISCWCLRDVKGSNICMNTMMCETMTSAPGKPQVLSLDLTRVALHLHGRVHASVWRQVQAEKENYVMN
jgi:hypothetical protein